MRIHSTILAAILVATAGGFTVADEASVEQLVRDIASRDASRRLAATQSLGTCGADAIAPLSAVLSHDDPAARRAARTAIESIAHRATRPDAGAERAAVETAIHAALSKASTPEAKSVLLRTMGAVGGPESVPIAAAALGAVATRDAACFALGRIPAPQTVQALSDALSATLAAEDDGDEALQLALLAALGAKKSVPTTQLLGDIAENGPSATIRLAALDALALNPSAYAWVYLYWSALDSADVKGSPAARRRVWDGLLRGAEAFLEYGERGSASDLLCDMWDKAQTSAERCAVIAVLSIASRRRAEGVVLAAAEDDDPAVRATAIGTLGHLRGLETLPGIEALLDRASPKRRAEILRAIAPRVEPEIVAHGAAALDSPDPDVRSAALALFEGRATAEAAEALIAAIVRDAPVVREGALGVLGRMPGEDVTHAILQAVDAAEGAARVRLLPALGWREHDEAKQLLVEAAAASDAATRLAAYRGLARAGNTDAEGLGALLLGVDRGGEEAKAALAAIARLSSTEITPALAAAVAERKGDTKAALLRGLARHQAPAVVDVLLASRSDAHAGVRMAALEGLCRQRDERAFPALVEAAVAGPESVRGAAAVACVRLGKGLESEDRARALAVYRRVLRADMVAHRDVRKTAVGAVGRLQDVDSLPLLEALFSDSRLREPAAAAVIAIASGLGADRRDEAARCLRKALPLAPSSPLAAAAVARVRGLGVDFDPARDAGFITRWRLLGPFASPQNRLFAADVLDPEKPIAVAGDAASDKWQPHHSPDARGIVHLDRALGPREDVAAYAYAEIDVPEARRVTLRIGSDDSCVCWLNGKRVHGFAGKRATRIDEDRVNVQLVRGTNRLLVKVLNESLGWSFCVRVTDRQGRPVVTAAKD